jgi:hypothetical protein
MAYRHIRLEGVASNNLVDMGCVNIAWEDKGVDTLHYELRTWEAQHGEPKLSQSSVCRSRGKDGGEESFHCKYRVLLIVVEKFGASDLLSETKEDAV